MSKESIIKKLLEENVDTGVKYHTPLPVELAPWYVYTVKSGHRILCVLKTALSGQMTEEQYRENLVPAPVKTVLRGYFIRDGFVIVEAPYRSDTGFVTEQEDREFDSDAAHIKYSLKVGELYHPGVTAWPETAEYNYFSGNHELRFFVNSPTRYVAEVIAKMSLQLGLFTQDDIILLVYKFTDYKKQMIPVHGYSPFSIHRVPENMRSLPVPVDAEHEELLRIHLVDSSTGILKAARSVFLSPEFSTALCSAIIAQSGTPPTDDYNDRLQRLDSMYPGTDSLMDHCRVKCTG